MTLHFFIPRVNIATSNSLYKLIGRRFFNLLITTQTFCVHCILKRKNLFEHKKAKSRDLFKIVIDTVYLRAAEWTVISQNQEKIWMSVNTTRHLWYADRNRAKLYRIKTESADTSRHSNKLQQSTNAANFACPPLPLANKHHKKLKPWIYEISSLSE